MRAIIVYALSIITLIITIVAVIGVIARFIDHFSCSIPGEQDCGETFALILESFVTLGMVAILDIVMYSNLMHL